MVNTLRRVYAFLSPTDLTWAHFIFSMHFVYSTDCPELLYMRLWCASKSANTFCIFVYIEKKICISFGEDLRILFGYEKYNLDGKNTQRFLKSCSSYSNEQHRLSLFCFRLKTTKIVFHNFESVFLLYQQNKVFFYTKNWKIT